MERDALYIKLLELDKVHPDDSDANMMTRTLSRKTFEYCCEIVFGGHIHIVVKGKIMCLKCPS